MTQAARILCVEDERFLREDIKEELEDAGYCVSVADNGRSAIEKIQCEKPDLILCDMMMPEMDGPTLLEHIRTNLTSLNDVPFIFLTARATRDDIIVGKRMGVDDYLTKPIDYDLLLATVEARLRQVELIDKSNKSKLLALYEEIKKAKGSPEPIRIAIVSSKDKIVEPIRAALAELGCVVKVLPEEQLARGDACVAKDDIVFLVYSKIVHYYLRFLGGNGNANSSAKLILLAPPNMSDNQKTALLDSGLDHFVEYPYRPVEIFKLIMERVQDGSQNLARLAQ